MNSQVVSVNVGKARRVAGPRGPVVTAIYKSPVHHRVALRGHQLEGDRQADLRVHGGPYKAVYSYAAEHYPYWAEQLSSPELPHGAFGENLTTNGLTEDRACIGDKFRIGSTVLQVAQPRMPCAKLALRHGRADMVKLFWNSNRPGIYFSVVEQGELGAGDAIERVEAHSEAVTVADVVRLFKGETQDEGLFARAMRTPLYGSWKKDIRARWAEREAE